MSYYYTPWYFRYPYYSYLSGYYPYFYSSCGYGGCGGGYRHRRHHGKHHKSGASRPEDVNTVVNGLFQRKQSMGQRRSGTMRVGVSNNGVFTMAKQTPEVGLTMTMKGDVNMLTKSPYATRVVTADTVEFSMTKSLIEKIMQDVMEMAAVEKLLESGQLKDISNVPDNADSAMGFAQGNMMPSNESLKNLNDSMLNTNVEVIKGRPLMNMNSVNHATMYKSSNAHVNRNLNGFNNTNGEQILNHSGKTTLADLNGTNHNYSTRQGETVRLNTASQYVNSSNNGMINFSAPHGTNL